MKLGLKLLTAPVLTAVIVYAVAQVNTVLLERGRAQSDQRVEQVLRDLGVVTETQSSLGRIHAEVYRTVSLAAALDEAKIKVVKAGTETQVSALAVAIDEVAKSSDSTADVRDDLAEVKKQLTSYTKQANQSLDFSMVDPNTGAVAMQDADATFQAIGKAMSKIVGKLDGNVKSGVEESKNNARTTSLVLALVGFAAAAAAVGISWWVQSHIVRELAGAAQVANAVAEGNLRVQVTTVRDDEVGDLLRALGRMREQLNSTLSQVLESGGTISVSSEEIARGTQDLSARTEQTASNLQATASSMGQLTTTVRQSADSARAANELASNAANVAGRGGNLVGQLVATMDEINHSSRKIADIISVIDGIAFQTNILALNAAVEAARAGEQGRGFAVVASEVRSLAGRSAEAAREIKTLIGTSVSKVDGGLTLVAEAGQTMNEIVSAVRSVTEMIAEITAVAAEQSSEIEQINNSITQLDQMTQQNAALVEQSTAAAMSLEEQANRMSGLVGSFQLSDGNAALSLGYERTS